MARVTSTITINQQRIRQLTEAQVQALEMTAEALHTEVVQAQVIPFDKGTLQNESTFVDYSNSSRGTVTLVSSTPYARRLYFHPEYNFKTSENFNAKGEWYDEWIEGEKKDFCIKTFKEFYKRLGGI